MKGICTLCGCESDELTWLELYVIGSEGVHVCLSCRMLLTRMAEGMKCIGSKVRLATHKEN